MKFAKPDAERRGKARRTRPADPAPASLLPLPEDVFLGWLLSVPPDQDVAAAAQRQIEIIDRRAPAHPDVHSLRKLLAVVAQGGNC